MQYKEIRTLSTGSVYRMCVQKGFYESGTNEEYSALLNKVSDWEESGKNLTANDLAELAKDIYEHSSGTAYTVEAIMWELSKRANVTFFMEE